MWLFYVECTYKLVIVNKDHREVITQGIHNPGGFPWGGVPRGEVFPVGRSISQGVPHGEIITPGVSQV